MRRAAVAVNMFLAFESLALALCRFRLVCRRAAVLAQLLFGVA